MFLYKEVMLFPAAMPAHILAFPYIHFHLQTAKHTPEDGKLPLKNLKHIQTRDLPPPCELVSETGIASTCPVLPLFTQFLLLQTA